jgi:pantoate--beta-alanine ligase
MEAGRFVRLILTPMRVLEKIGEMREASRACLRNGRRVGLVPTMGALHEGHLSLVRAARAKCDTVAVSIFVNPTQFGPLEDFSQYPRTFDRDCELLRGENVDLVFAPAVQEIYPAQPGSAGQQRAAVPAYSTWIEVAALSDRLDGKSRPGHFRGVATVVAKLFHIVEPDVAFFGQKDAAQLLIIRRMVRDLNFPIEVVGCPIVREPDGLAMSSRNAYLSSEERKLALLLNRSLREVEQAFRAGEHRIDALIRIGSDAFSLQPAVRLDYFEIVNPETLEPPAQAERSLVAVAAYVGTTRLIDNLLLEK